MAVRCAYCLRDVLLTEQVVEPVEGRIAPGIAAAVEYMPGRERYGLGVLDIEVRLLCWSIRVICSAIDQRDRVSRKGSIGAKLLHEQHQVGRARVLIIVSHNAEHVEGRRSGHVGGRMIQPP